MDIIKALETRYSTKKFDSQKEISKENMEKIEDLLQLSPSSTNVQPWHFVVATTKEGKERIAKAAEGFYSFNKDKVLDASAVVILSTKLDITEEYLNHVTEKETQDGRFANDQLKNDNHFGRKTFVDFHKYDFKDAFQWAERQVYLNLGNLLLGAGALGIDAIAMEGIDMKALDMEFGLREKGFAPSVVASLGYHTEDDFNAKLPKSRLSKDEIIDRV